MKKKFICLILFACSLISSSCIHKTTHEDVVFKIKRVEKIEKRDEKHIYESLIMLDFPIQGPQPLLDSIRCFINQELNGDYSGDLADWQSMLNYYNEKYLNAMGVLLSVSPKQKAYLEKYNLSIMFAINLRLESETEKVVNYYFYFDKMLVSGKVIKNPKVVTFRKSDGKIMKLNDLIVDTESIEFLNIINDALREYLSETREIYKIKKDSELDEMITLKTIKNSIQHSSCYMGATELRILYNALQEYHETPITDYFHEDGTIAAHISLSIPYTKLKKVLTKDALELIE